MVAGSSRGDALEPPPGGGLGRTPWTHRRGRRVSRGPGSPW